MSVSIHMASTLTEAWKKEMLALEKHTQDNPLDKRSTVFKRALEWEDFYLRHIPNTGGSTATNIGALAEPPLPITRDFLPVTALHWMQEILRMIPQLCYENKDFNSSSSIEIYKSIAKNSYPLFEKMMVMEGSETQAIEQILSRSILRRPFYSSDYVDILNEDFNSSKFHLEQCKNGYSVNLNDDVHEEAKKILSNFKRTNQHYVSVCPAGTRIDGKSANEKLWDWYCEIAPHIWKSR